MLAFSGKLELLSLLSLCDPNHDKQLENWIKHRDFEQRLCTYIWTPCWIPVVTEVNKIIKGNHQTHSGFFDLSQLSRASLLKAAVAALLLLLRWILAMVSEFFTTSIRPILFPVDKQP